MSEDSITRIGWANGHSEPSSARLMIMEGPSTGGQLALDRKRITIGRAKDNALILDSPHVSRRHASIDLRTGSYEIRDLDSRNGVAINGRRIDPETPTSLSHGDVIQVGDHAILFIDSSSQVDSHHLSTIRVDRARVRQEVDAMLKRRRQPDP